MSVLPAHVHTERWRTPSLKQFYDVTVPSVIKDILKGTGQQAQIKKVFPDANVKQRYNELKKLESVTDELMNTTFNNKSNIANMSDVQMVEYLSKNVPLGKFPEGIDFVTSSINKDMFLIMLLLQKV